MGARGSSKPNSSKERPGIKEQELRTTTVLFVEFSQGGTLQKSMRDALDRLTPMLGFRTRVAEMGGTGDKKEPCTTRNIVYESECGTCNPAGSRKASDKE